MSSAGAFYDIKVDFDMGALTRKYKNRVGIAQKKLDEAVIKDTDRYVRYRTGVLARSVQTASHIGEGLIVYDTPYAKKIYYDTKSQVTKDVHRDATPMWVDVSKKKNLANWIRTAERVLKGED